MICGECGKKATYWLCSDACALAYAVRRGRRECAICSYDAKTGRIGRNDTTKICAECRRRSENVDWVHKKHEEADELIETKLAESERLRDQQDRPLPEVTPEMTEIARLIVEGEQVAYKYRDRSGESHGVRYRWRAYTARRLAKKLGCSRAAVERVIRSIEK
jgi:hypothetical protein